MIIHSTTLHDLFQVKSLLSWLNLFNLLLFYSISGYPLINLICKMTDIPQLPVFRYFIIKHIQEHFFFF